MALKMKKLANETINEVVIRKKWYKNTPLIQLYSMLAIPVIFVFIFNYVPLYGIQLAFKDYNFSLGIWGSKWVGFDNIRFFVTSNEFLKLTWNTLSLNFIFIIVGMITAIGIAVLLYELKSVVGTKIYQTVLISPNFVSWVLVSYIVYIFLNPTYGIANQVLESFGMEKIDWYSTPNAWPTILTLSSIWKNVGMDCIIYYAALVGIDPTYFEAAEIDGATRWQTIKHIMIPFMKPLVTILLIMKIGGIFRADFGLFYQVTRNVGALYSTTDVIDTYIFRTMRVVGDMGMGAAVGLLQNVVGFSLVMATNAIVNKIDSDNALF